MTEVCQYWWQSDTCGWNIVYTWVRIWRWWDVIQRGIFLGLVLMLGYTIFVLLRFFRRYYLARRELRDLNSESWENSCRTRRELVADLSPGLGMLRGIATAAPFLGLAGMCYGILAGFQIIPGSRASALSYVVRIIVDAPITTVAGILVAIPAAFAHGLIRARLEALRCRSLRNRNSNANDMGSFHFAQTLPLKSRFVSPPHYALIAAPALACVIMAYMGSRLYPMPAGLPISVARDRCEPGLVDRSVVLRVTSEGKLFLNYEPEDWSGISKRLSDIYRMRYDRVLYLEAPDDVPFQTVADAIDRAEHPMAGTDSLALTVRVITPQTEAENALCHAPLWIGPRARGKK